MFQPSNTSVYIVDDHELVREGLRALLDGAGYSVVGESESVEDAVNGIVETRPAVAIIDVRLADGSGVDVCRQVGLQSPDTACLMLTSFDDDDSVFDAIEAGAAGFLLKKIRNLELVESIHRVANGERLLDSVTTARVLDRLRFGRQHDPDPLLNQLNLSERHVLDLVAEGLSNREIGERMHLAEKTVKNYVSRVLATLRLRSRTQAALYVTSNSRLSAG
jgi:DNA-binding NarL/FixJ family response regulator